MLTYFMPYLADKLLNIVIEIETEILIENWNWQITTGVLKGH